MAEQNKQRDNWEALDVVCGKWAGGHRELHESDQMDQMAMAQRDRSRELFFSFLFLL